MYTVKSVMLFLGELLPLLLPSLGNFPHKQEGQCCPGSPWPGFPAAGHRQWVWQLTWLLLTTRGPARGSNVRPYTLHPALLVPAPLSDLNLFPGTLAWWQGAGLWNASPEAGHLLQSRLCLGTFPGSFHQTLTSSASCRPRNSTFFETPRMLPEGLGLRAKPSPGAQKLSFKMGPWSEETNKPTIRQSSTG